MFRVLRKTVWNIPYFEMDNVFCEVIFDVVDVINGFGNDMVEGVRDKEELKRIGDVMMKLIEKVGKVDGWYREWKYLTVGDDYAIPVPSRDYVEIYIPDKGLVKVRTDMVRFGSYEYEKIVEGFKWLYGLVVLNEYVEDWYEDELNEFNDILI